MNVWILFTFIVFKKLMFLYKLTGINNNCLKVCLRLYRRSVNLSLYVLSLILIYVIVVLSKVMF